MHNLVLHHSTLPPQKDEIWRIRPLTATLLDGCVKDVAYLKILRLKLLDQMMKGITEGTAVYLSCCRDHDEDYMLEVSHRGQR